MNKEREGELLERGTYTSRIVAGEVSIEGRRVRCQKNSRAKEKKSASNQRGKTRGGRLSDGERGEIRRTETFEKNCGS